jgi:hypothetical protein
MRILFDMAICIGLLYLLVLLTKAIIPPEQRHTPPAPDADEESDNLPFGPAPKDTDNY